MSGPKRIQRKRTKGWRMPENCVYVGRPTKWGNPFPINPSFGIDLKTSMTAYRQWMLKCIRAYNPNCAPQYHGLNIEELRGKDLACWCSLDQECHADILIELANHPGANP